MKKTLSVLCATTMLASVLAACESNSGNGAGESTTSKAQLNETGLPIVNEKVTLRLASPKSPIAPDYNDMTIFKNMEKATNVHIEWNNIPGDGYQEKKNLMLASGDLPDAFYASGFSDNDLVKYGAEGTLLPLETLIDKYAPNLKALFEQRPELKKMVTAPDGHIYSLPRAEEMDLINMPNIMVINKTWLDKLGLPMPTTVEEYKNTLIAFRDKDPNGNGKKDEIPLTWWWQGWCGNEGDLFAWFGLPDTPFENDHRIVKDGKVIYSAVQPEYKAALTYLHKWYKDGLIDPEVTTLDPTKLFAKGKTKDVTVGSFIWWEIEEVVGTDRAKDYVVLPPLKGVNGDILVGRSNYSEYGRDAFVMTKANKNQEITMRWVDQMYEPKMSAQVNWGPIGDVYETDAKGMLVNKKLPEGVAMGELRQKVAPGGPFVVLKEHFGTVVDMEPRAKQRLNDLKTYYKPYQVKESYPWIFFGPEESSTMNRINTEIKQVVAQKKAKWLMEGGIEQEWNDYVKQLDGMGLPKLMKIWQDGMDKFNK
ncbi:putative aldouronate transport system substrate-binding protein [Paenibacillus sp. V4I3]|uniref:ABC transporter substrate-binding protein n=1 Tax=Paenibacillus sp. V4I3 TaxID=3042305 RepID=UPI0027804797|nr:ABC transporter substrate-binding protein [Paenibacillus sp. V4I3]MDQ0876538.1 putative aldouronate transport system substrate-binding protein [Paenibacillus sp. V4I3]